MFLNSVNILHPTLDNPKNSLKRECTNYECDDVMMIILEYVHTKTAFVV
jgi:hypothetical protein